MRFLVSLILGNRETALYSAKKGLIQLYQTNAFNMAEEGGFEPPRRVNDLLAFQASPFSHLGTPPCTDNYIKSCETMQEKKAKNDSPF